ncbi:hypothetical protein Psuf_066830 [Phytohabitans suffuscus]|uniref:Malonyl-CoA:ACP transacylase (MAT) domain-containing protein n=1 Tax=Phytohabitans suffuscus TaxID=624315 RepID=A0A6F8YT91_9ACTN|nr:hypothetical protein Psuf_066830 [Phytohabitans suffuscus]
MRAGLLPRTLHADEPSPHVEWSGGGVRLLAEPVPWPAVDGRPRRAGVSSFGVSGTNAHVILEEAAPAQVPSPDATPDGAPVGWVISGHSDAALRAQAGRLRAHLARRPEVAPLDVARSLGTGRAGLSRRAAALGADRADLLRGLDAIAAGEPVAPGVVRGTPVDGGLAFLFTGQGGQRAGMGEGLAAAFPVFGDAWREVLSLCDPDLVAGLGDGRVDQTGSAQVGLFAFEVAMFRLWESWGVVPDFVLGHSVGEIAAATVAGVLGVEDAARLVSARGRLMQALPAGGGMVAVEATEAEVAGTLPEGVEIAAVNGRRAVVVSGPLGPVEAVGSGGGRPAGVCGGCGFRTRSIRRWWSRCWPGSRRLPRLSPTPRRGSVWCPMCLVSWCGSSTPATGYGMCAARSGSVMGWRCWPSVGSACSWRSVRTVC